MRKLLFVALCLALLSLSGGGVNRSQARSVWRTSQFENVLGTSLEMKFAVASDASAERAEASDLDRQATSPQQNPQQQNTPGGQVPSSQNPKGDSQNGS